MSEEKQYPFEFSVVMAVYNVEPFLREAVDSLIGQDFGFEKIQLIMVDDGSTDGSGAICDEYAVQYPDNVIVVHKENGGVASARNEGLKYATGRYLNFMDSDDYFTRNTFTTVYRFLVKNDGDVDIATIPLEFFDAMGGEHWQNDKFKKGTRILDLFWDYQASIMFVNASFFHSRVKKEICFDSHLVCGEDMKVLLSILIHKMKLGVVTGCKYMYRRRSVGEASLIQSSQKKYGWYFDYFTYLVDWAVDLYQSKFGYLPAFIQYELLADLQWRFRQIYDMTQVLSKEEIQLYKERLFATLKLFDDRYILEQKMLWHEHICYILGKKYDRKPELTERGSNVIVHFGNVKLNSFADQFGEIENLKIENQKLIVEGYIKLFGIDAEEPVDMFLKVNEKLVPCDLIKRTSLDEYRFEELIFRGIAFRGEVALDEAQQSYEVHVVLRYKNSYITKRNLRFGVHSPIGRELRSGYYYHENWLAQVRNQTITISHCGRKGRIKAELRLLREIWKRKTVGSKKAVAARVLYWGIKQIQRKEIWLLSDRVHAAGDNGEAFFEFLKKRTNRTRKLYFVLSKNSPDYMHIASIGTVVTPFSWRHKLLHLLSSKIISSHADEICYNPFGPYMYYYRDLLQNGHFVFLQHGVIKDDLARWMSRYKIGASGFVVSAWPEKRSIVDGEYGYPEDYVWITGLPRYDKLYHDEKKRIVIMPTWRAYLVQGDGVISPRQLNSKFTGSMYCKMYSQLLRNKKLCEAAERLGYTIQYVSHPNMAGETEHFSIDTSVLQESEMGYTKIFAESDLLITDYSSVAFDFAYLRKPVVYFQADYDEFFLGEHTYDKGYFDYERDGFGEVEYDIDSIVDRIIEYLENGCRLKDEYRERIDHFFAFQDKNNCQRVYEKILEL